MVDQVKNGAKNILNNKYNKGIYSGIAGAGLTIVFTALKDNGVDVSVELQGSITTFVMLLITLLVGNKSN